MMGIDTCKGLKLGVLNYLDMQGWPSLNWPRADSCLSCVCLCLREVFQNETKKASFHNLKEANEVVQLCLPPKIWPQAFADKEKGLLR